MEIGPVGKTPAHPKVRADADSMAEEFPVFFDKKTWALPRAAKLYFLFGASVAFQGDKAARSLFPVVIRLVE